MRAALVIAMTLLPSLVAAGEFFTLKGHGGPVRGLAEGPGGAILTASFDNSVGYWRGGAPVWLDGHRAAVNAVRFIDATRAVSASDDFELRLWNLETGASRALTGHKGKVMALAVSPDRALIASASWDGRIGLWPVDGGAARFLTGHDAGVNDVAFSADGLHLYSASTDGTIRLWDLTAGEEKRLLLRHGFGVNTLLLNEADGWLAYGAVDGVTRVINPDTGEAMADFTLDRRPILAIAGNPEFTQIAVSDGEGFIMVIDTGTWQISRDFRAARYGPVWALGFSADGANVHAAGLDDIMYSWPIETMDEHGQMTTAARSFLKDPGEMDNGERQFMRKCSICHALTPDSQRRAGPSLHGVFGRPAGTLDGYSYSATLQNSDIIWSEETISALFDLGPDHYIPGSKMPMQRITRPGDRADLVAFLRRATTQGD